MEGEEKDVTGRNETGRESDRFSAREVCPVQKGSNETGTNPEFFLVVFQQFDEVP
jgi:hypothetical protein